MFYTQPALRREGLRAFIAKTLVPGEQADYSVAYSTVEVPLNKAKVVEDQRRHVIKAQPGDVLLLTPKTSLLVQNRIVMVEVPQKLYTHGVPVFRRLFRHGEEISAPVYWTCLEALDLSTLPFLFEAYIVNQHVRTTP